MKLFDLFKRNANPKREESQSAFDKLIKDSVTEHQKLNLPAYAEISVSKLSLYQEKVKNWPNEEKLSFIRYCIEEVKANGLNAQEKKMARAYLTHLMRTKLMFDEKSLVFVSNAFSDSTKKNHYMLGNWPVAHFINLLVKQHQVQELPQGALQALEKLKNRLQSIVQEVYYEKEATKMIHKIDTILYQGEESAVKPTLFPGNDPLADYANPQISGLTDESEKENWYLLIMHAQKATGSKPSKKYLKEAKQLIEQMGAAKFKRMVHDWLAFTTSMKEAVETQTYTYGGQTYTNRYYQFLSAPNSEILKGLVWMLSHFQDAGIIQSVGRLAERAYKKIPGQGPAAAAIGNACFFTLFQSEGMDGVGQLSRLKVRIKQKNAVKTIEKYLKLAAEAKGISPYDIEELAVDEAGLKEGKRTWAFEEHKAILEITGTGKSALYWVKPDGKHQKSVPAFVKEKYAENLKQVKSLKKHVDQLTAAQRDRIDRLFRFERSWIWEDFEKRYVHHGLVNFLTKRLIWSMETKGKKQTALYLDGKWVDAQEQEIDLSPETRVSLWHPANQPIAEVQQWRAFMQKHQIRQPMKQAYREVYLLTDAEMNTRSYSNRMAAHILKQHQYVNLAKGRSWSASLMGAWDGGDQDIATLDLPEYGIQAQFWVQSVDMENGFNESGIWNYVSTDQVRFVNTTTDSVMNLVDVPPVLFSEVMRDVDLFVGVASVGNDPMWQDSGARPQYRTYWENYSFGDLSTIAQNRKEILEGLIPRLKIREVAEIQDRFLVVKGNIRTYKIHIGSTNILMEPNDQYLCIVPDRSKKSPAEQLFVPFEGDNGLSVILSKAFLLAEDTKITDPTILSQLRVK